MPDVKPRVLISNIGHIKSQWLNVILTHSKLTCSPFLLISKKILIIYPFFSSLYRDDR